MKSPILPLLAVCWWSFVASAQQFPAGLTAPAAPVASSRDAEYELLAADVAALERELGIYRRVVKLVTPAVVHIESRPAREHRFRQPAEEAGSGVVVLLDGKPLVLTNRHVIKNSSPPYIRMHFANGAVLNPERIWSHAETDVAVMQVPLDGLEPARLGNSDEMEIGDQVLVIGSPFGLSRSVTRGIVSAKGRYNLELGEGEVELQNFLQTDAAINPGNSGGPLINLRGEVIGLNTAIASNSGGNEGVGFSIPINIVVRVARELVRNGEVNRGFLGVKLDGLFDDRRGQSVGLESVYGTRVKGVEPGSPAERADLRIDDVIIAYDGVRIDDDDHLISLVQLTEVGRRVNLTVLRQGQPQQVQIEIGSLPLEFEEQ